MKIDRTVIGSFPKIDFPLDEAIKSVVDLQLCYDIDIITDGEQRGDMIEYFRQIIVDENKKIVKIKPMSSLDDFFKIVDYHKIRSYLDSINKKNVKIKIALTGPLTLGYTFLMKKYDYSPSMPTAAMLNPKYNEQKLYSDISQVLVALAKKCFDIGAFVQIDEPGISAFNIPLTLVRKILNDFFNQLPKDKRVSIHVCGSIDDRVYKELLDLNVKTISLAFSEEKDNINIISRKSLEDNQKMLGIGFISNITVENKETALERLKQIAEIVGVENISCIHPDCGLRNTSKENVELILENMKKSSEEFLQSFS